MSKRVSVLGYPYRAFNMDYLPPEKNKNLFISRLLTSVLCWIKFFNFHVFAGITDAALMPLLALLVDKRHNGVYGGVYSISQLAVCLAYALGPSIAGHVVKSFGFVTLMRVVAALNLAYAPLCWFLRDVSGKAETEVILPTNQRTCFKYTNGETSHFKYQLFDNE